MTVEENIQLLVDSFNRDVAFEAQRLKLRVREAERLLRRCAEDIEGEWGPGSEFAAEIVRFLEQKEADSG